MNDFIGPVQLKPCIIGKHDTDIYSKSPKITLFRRIKDVMSMFIVK